MTKRVNGFRPSAGISTPLLALTICLAMLFGVFLGFVRPWYLRWGATDPELRQALPGDEIIAGAVSQETRAITIRAPIERVWPWLAQLGQDRGGFYSFDLLENWVGCAMPTEDRLRPEAQSWRIGDKLWMYPKDKADGQGFATLRVYVPGRALAFGAHAPGAGGSAPEDGSWAMVLEPIDASTTRLVVRGRGAARRSWLGVAFDRSIFEPVHFVMERRMMTGLAQLAEGVDRGRSWNHVAVALWIATFAMSVAASVLVLNLRSWGRALASFLAAGTVFQILTLRQPPIALAVACVVVLGAMVPWRSPLAARPRRRGRPLAIGFAPHVAGRP